MIPDGMTELRQWVTWRYVDRDGEKTKVPFQLNGEPAKSNDPSTWANYEDVSTSGQFIGFVFAEGGGWFGIDLDECLEKGGEIAAWAAEILERFPFAYVETSPSGRGLKLFCRGTLAGGKKRLMGPKGDRDKAPGLEVYGKGRFFTVTGEEMQPAGDGDESEGLAWLLERFWPAVKPAPAPTTGGSIYTSAGNDVERRALAWLDCADPAISGCRGHDRTFAVAGALVHGFLLSPAAALPLMAGWNARCDPPWSESDLARKLEQALAAPCNKERGWLVNEALESAEVRLSGVDLSELLGGWDIPEGEPVTIEPSAAAELSPIDPGEFPVELALKAPGLIGEIVSYDLRTSMYEQPALALAAALGVMSVVTGRKVCGHNDVRTNLYILGLAPSGGGKNHGRSIAKRLLSHAGASDLVGPERIGSHSGIITRLAAHPATLCPVDEIGDLLALMRGTGTKTGAIANIEPLLKSLYSAANDDAWISDALAKAEHVKTICQPHLVVHGVCPPANYWGNITAANIENGLIARFMAFEAGHVLPTWRDTREDLPGNVVEALRTWFLFAPAGPGGQFGASHPVPIAAKYTAEAFQLLKDHSFAIAAKRMQEDERTAAIWSRCAEKSSKLALLAACSRCVDPAAGVQVTAEDVAWGKRIALWTTRRMVWRVSESVADNAEEERKKTLLRLIPRGEGITLTMLTRATRKLKRTERNSALEDLAESGLITMRKKGDTGGRPTVTLIRV